MSDNTNVPNTPVEQIPTPPKPSSKKWLLVTAIVVTILAAVGITAFMYLRSTTGSTWGDIKVETNDSETVTKTIGLTGGTIELTDTVLTIPENSVLLDTEISLTPITKLGNEKLDEGFITGVDLSPDGTILVSGGTLTMTLPEGTDTSDIGVIAYEGDGTDVTNYPFELEGNIITLEISGFSGYGTGTGYNGNSEGYTQDIADLTDDGDYSDADEKEMLAIFKRWYNEVIKPELTAATTNETLLKPAFKNYTQWYVLSQFFGVDDQLTTENEEAQGLIVKALKNAVDKSYDKCVNSHDLTGIDDMLYWSELAQTLGYDDEPGLGTEEVEEKIRSCATFELQIDSTIIDKGWGADALDIYTTGSTTLSLNSDLTAFEGTGTQALQHYIYDGVTCPVTPPITRALSVIAGTMTGGKPSLTIQIETYAESFNTHLHACQVTENFSVHYTGPDIWVMDFEELHEDEFLHTEVFAKATALAMAGDMSAGEATSDLGLDYLITGWNVLGGEKYAEKVYNRTNEDYTEDTTFTLMHTPASN